MSTQFPADEDRPPANMTGHLGYLLKHVQLRFAELSGTALAPFGISGRQVAVLRAIDSPPPLVQGEIARRMGIDRTTMVALIDELADRGFVRRRQDPQDRRRNVVELTDDGRDLLRKAVLAAREAEHAFLRPLTPAQAAQFRDVLRALLNGARPDS